MEPFRTKPEVADRYQVSIRTITNWMRLGKIRFHKADGGSVRFLMSELEEDTANYNPTTPHIQHAR
jgi:excisionase family DNA binding protein